VPGPRTLVVATRNAGKLREIVALLTGLPVQVVSLEAYPDLPEVEEPHDTFAANATAKACETARATGHWALADDSGLAVDALDGAPGVLSARVAGSDPARIAWLLAQLSGAPVARRTARFVCALCLASPESVLGQWEGTAEGVILDEARGHDGFGYDPVFLDPGTGRTFAEMTRDAKSAISHRGRALRAFAADLPGLLAAQP
jgi:XTP/dITP diphosphohydrolase